MRSWFEHLAAPNGSIRNTGHDPWDVSGTTTRCNIWDMGTAQGFLPFFFFLRFEFSLQVYHLCFDGEKVYILRFVGNFIVLVFITSQGECIRF